MKEKSLVLSDNVKIEWLFYENIPQTDVSIDIVEIANEYWHGNTYTNIDITKEKAQEIIAFLTEAFEL